MQKYEIQWFTDNEGIKLFKSNRSSIFLIDFQKDDLFEARKILKNIEFTAGIYILEAVDENNDAKKHIYVGESDNVWARIKNHIQKKSQIKDKDFINFIKRISIILSSDALGGLGKTEIQWLEKELINEFSYLSNIIVENGTKESKKVIGFIDEKSLTLNLDYIKKALYHTGKLYFATSLEDIQIENDSKNLNNIENQKWIEVFPIIRKNRNIKFLGKFEYNVSLKIIKSYKGAFFKGTVKGSLTNDDYLDYYLKKYKDKGFLNGWFDKKKRKYEIRIIKDLELKPSTLSIFTRAGVANGWVSWKDKKEKLINEYKKNNLKINKKDFINKFESNLKNTNFENELENISVNKKKNLNINYKDKYSILTDLINESDWFEVFPVFSKKDNVRVNENAKFQFSISKKLIKISKGTVFRGIIKKRNNYDSLSDSFKKYKNKGNAKGSIDFLTGRYEIEVTKDLITSPSTAAFFTKAGIISNGWLCWQNKEGVLIKNIKNINENQE